MTNGEMLEEIQKILDGEQAIPQKVTNRMVVAALVQINNNVNGLAGRVEALENRKPDCDNCRRTIIQEIEKASVKEHEKMVTWPWVLEKLAQPVLMMILAAVIGAVAARLF